MAICKMDVRRSKKTFLRALLLGRSCYVITIVAVSFVLIITKLIAAEIHVSAKVDEDGNSQKLLVTISDTADGRGIAASDAAYFKKILNPLIERSPVHDKDEVTISLNSKGGDFSAALIIAQYIMKMKFATLVPNGATCLSACALIFLAGENQMAYSSGNDRTLEIGGSIAFHAPFPRIGAGKQQQGISDARKIHKILGKKLPSDLYDELLGASPKNFVYVATVYDALQWDIDLSGFERSDFSASALFTACANELRIKLPGAVVDAKVGDHAILLSGTEILKDSEGHEILDQNNIPITSDEVNISKEVLKSIIVDNHTDASGKVLSISVPFELHTDSDPEERSIIICNAFAEGPTLKINWKTSGGAQYTRLMDGYVEGWHAFPLGRSINSLPKER